MRKRTNTAASVSTARQSLQEARDDLDNAMLTLADVGADNAMASPALLALLLRAVAARRDLSGLELTLAKEEGPSLFS